MDTGQPNLGNTRLDEMQARLIGQKTAFQKDLPVSADIRVDRLTRAIALLVDHQDKLADAMASDFDGRPKLMSLFTDIASSIKSLKIAKANVRRWMAREKRPLDLQFRLLGSKAWVEYQPKGVIGLISPWNFPVNLTFSPLAGIFAAGNRVMIKPSEHTPATSEVMAELFAQAYDADEVAVFTGGPEVGQAYTGLAFDHLMFTGATSIGRHVMRAAADNLVPVTLELGGKSPVIVSRSADMGQMAERIVASKLMNAGQICLAPDYLLVPTDKLEETATLLKETADRLYGAAANDTASVIHTRHVERLSAHLADAASKGAQIRHAGPKPADAPGRDRLMDLAVITGVTEEMSVMGEEIFGPLLPLIPYETIDDAIAYITARDRPLGLYYFGTDEGELRQVLDHTHSGGVTVNDTVFHVSMESLPFGGIGPSGMGAYHGQDGFKEFSHARPVYKQTSKNLLRLIGALPPYGTKLRSVLKTQIRK